MAAIALADAFEEQRAAIIATVGAILLANQHPKDVQISPTEMDIMLQTSARLAKHDLINNTTSGYGSFWAELSVNRVRASHRKIGAFLAAIAVTEATVIEHLAPYYADDAPAMRHMMQRVNEICTKGREVLYVTFSQERETIIREQTVAIEELSTPVVPIYRGVLVLPLVGRIDGERAQTIMQTLLHTVAQQAAAIVLLDVTGVPLIDTATAQHIIQAARALQLLGAEVVLVGISPEIAQTIVQLGINLRDIVTRADLQAGFAYALGRCGMRIVAQDRS